MNKKETWDKIVWQREYIGDPEEVLPTNYVLAKALKVVEKIPNQTRVTFEQKFNIFSTSTG